MASSVVDSAIKGVISGFTTSLDMNTGYRTNVADAAAGVQNTAEGHKNSIQGTNSKVWYDQPDNSRSTQLQLMLAHTANEYIQSGDIGTSLEAGSRAVQDHNNMSYRASEAANLDEQGFDPIGIKSWIVSGDNKDLVTGMGQQIVNINGKNVRLDAKDALALQKDREAEAQQKIANQQWEQGHQLDVQKTNYDTSKPISEASPGSTLIMPDQSVVQVPYSPYQQGVRNGNQTGPQGGAGIWTDPETGEQGVILTNSRGTPLIDQKSGNASVRMPSGQVRQISINETRMNASGKGAALAISNQSRLIGDSNGNITPNTIRNSDFIKKFNDYGNVGKLGREVKSLVSSDARAFYNDISTFNGQVRSMVTDRLIFELGGRQPNQAEIDAEVGKIGNLSADMSGEQAAVVAERANAYANDMYNTAAAKNPNPTLGTTNTSQPKNVPNMNRATTNIPNAAVEALRQNPSLKAQFDAHYGAGASDRVLGGQ